MFSCAAPQPAHNNRFGLWKKKEKFRRPLCKWSDPHNSLHTVLYTVCTVCYGQLATEWIAVRSYSTNSNWGLLHLNNVIYCTHYPLPPTNLRELYIRTIYLKFMCNVPNMHSGARNVIQLIVHITHFWHLVQNYVKLIDWKIVANESLQIVCLQGAHIVLKCARKRLWVATTLFVSA